MITWKTHSNIYIARNPLNGVYSFDILNHNEKMLGVILPRNAAEQKQLIQQLNTDTVELKHYQIFWLGGY